MKQNRIAAKLISLISLLLVAFLLLGLTACTPADQPDNPPDEQPPEKTLTIAENGKSLYRIVRGDQYTSNDMEVIAAVQLKHAMGTVLGNMPDIVTDFEDRNHESDIREILVGRTNRAESCSVYNVLAEDEYAIRVIGNKIVLAGGSDDLLQYAVTVFLRECCGYLSATSYTAADQLTILENLDIWEVYTVPSRIVLYQTKDDVSYVKALSDQLRMAGFDLTEYTQDADPNVVFDPNESDLVLFVGADVVPSTAIKAMEAYLEKQGRVLFLGGPAFETVLYELDGKWYSLADYVHEQIEQIDDEQSEVLLPLSDASFVKKHGRSTGHVANKYKVEVDDFGLTEGDSENQLYHYVSNMESWDVLSFSNLSVRGKGYQLISFYAMPGDDHTPCFSLEIKDKQGARWYANILFTSDDWTQYVLTPSDFTWWQDGASPQSETPNFDDIVHVQIGFANSYRSLAAGAYSYYCSDITLYAADWNMPTASSVPYIEGVSPLTELYPITNAANLETCDNQSFVTSRDYVLPESLISCHPGRQATGYDKGATARFIPLIRVTDEKGLHSGYAAWIHLLSSKTGKNGALEGAMIGTFGATSDDFYNADGIAAVVETARAMTAKAHLVDGGTTEYIYVSADTDTITAGATYISDDEKPEVRIELLDGDTSLAVISSETTKAKSVANGLMTVSDTFSLANGKPTCAKVTLSLNGKEIDSVTQTISYWEAKPESERSYIYAEDGYFKRNGEIISFFGVNYMPSYGCSEQDGTLFEHYISDAAYDPTTVAYDLQHIKDIGMNAVSVFCYYDYVKDCNNILDLVYQCEQMGIYVDLSIRSKAYPLSSYYSDEQVKTLVQRLHFHENDNIIAYDIAWEPRVGSYQATSSYIGREHWDADWLQWILDNYGSVAHAELLWGTKIAKNGKGIPVITDEILNNTGTKYQKAVAAYYAFLDEVIAADMQVHMADMQALAPNQMFSFRMSMSGSTLRTSSMNPANMCFDFQSLASTMALMEPEGYALGTTEEAALQIMFANAYARYTKPNSPVVWKEYGRHVWTGSANGNFAPDDGLLRGQAEYYRYALDYCLTSYTSGMFCWYYAGGYRIGEDSDYGILNPDGSDRPVTQLLREYAPRFISQGERQSMEVVAERDDYVGGLFGMFDAIKDELAAAYRDGLSVTLINKQQSGATEYAYADELLDFAVGGTAATGDYPLRYVGGQIKQVRFATEDGQEVAYITVCNTKQSVWRAGTVSIVTTDDSKVTLRTAATIEKDLSYLEETTITVPISGKGKLILRFDFDSVTSGIRYEITKK